MASQPKTVLINIEWSKSINIIQPPLEINDFIPKQNKAKRKIVTVLCVLWNIYVYIYPTFGNLCKLLRPFNSEAVCRCSPCRTFSFFNKTHQIISIHCECDKTDEQRILGNRLSAIEPRIISYMWQIRHVCTDIHLSITGSFDRPTVHPSVLSFACYSVFFVISFFFRCFFSAFSLLSSVQYFWMEKGQVQYILPNLNWQWIIHEIDNKTK